MGGTQYDRGATAFKWRRQSVQYGSGSDRINQPIDQVREQELSVLYLELNLECGVT